MALIRHHNETNDNEQITVDDDLFPGDLKSNNNKLSSGNDCVDNAACRDRMSEAGDELRPSCQTQLPPPILLLPVPPLPENDGDGLNSGSVVKENVVQGKLAKVSLENGLSATSQTSISAETTNTETAMVSWEENPALDHTIVHSRKKPARTVEDEALARTSLSTSIRNDGLHKQQRKDSGRLCGRMGLGNLGNTCFLNSTLQCLGHTDGLREFFLNGEYKAELNADNPLGTGGELATEFARLLEQMWKDSIVEDDSSSTSYSNGLYYGGNSNSSTVVYPRNFKHVLGRHASQFVGYDQHDSQEVAIYLLDALHEDTNRVSRKPYVEKPEQKESETDENAAAVAWDAHLKREDSNVIELFMGQSKSRVECPVQGCGRVSTTFDPFMYLSVPIPGASDRTIKVKFVPLDSRRRNMSLSVTLSKTSTFEALQEKISEALRSDIGGFDAAEVDKANLCVVDMWNSEIYKFFDSKDEISCIKETDETYVYQLTPVSVIRAEEIDEEMSNAMDDDATGNNGDGKDDREERCCGVNELDNSTKLMLDRNDVWMKELEKYVSSISQLIALLNTKWSSHEDRLAFIAKFKKFLDQCRACPDAQVNDESKQAEYGQITSNAPVSSKSSTDDALMLEERCHTSTSFKNILARKDILIAEFCLEKLIEHSHNIVRERKEKHRDGVLVQVSHKQSNNNSYGSSGGQPLRVPMIIRISPRCTVYGLRQIVAGKMRRSLLLDDKLKFGRSMHSNSDYTESNGIMEDDNDAQKNEGEGSSPATSSIQHRSQYSDKVSPPFPKSSNGVSGLTSNADSSYAPTNPDHNTSTAAEMCVFARIPLTYQRKTSYSSYGVGSGNHQLGSVKSSAKSNPAKLEDEEEKEYISETVGLLGSIVFHWPSDTANEFLNKDELVAEDNACSDFELDLSSGSSEKRAAAGVKVKKKVTVLDCIKRYCQTEQLEESDMWYCNRCKQHVQAWKQIRLYRTPPILIIHLKRFLFSATTHRRDKIDVQVEFPLEGLDLTECVQTLQGSDETVLYDCYAVSNHYGGLGGGHYTAYAKNNGKWCYFDDCRVTEDVDENDVVSSAAYVLYYKRRDLKVESRNGHNVSANVPKNLSTAESLSSMQAVTLPPSFSTSQEASYVTDEMEVDNPSDDNISTNPNVSDTSLDERSADHLDEDEFPALC